MLRQTNEKVRVLKLNHPATAFNYSGNVSFQETLKTLHGILKKIFGNKVLYTTLQLIHDVTTHPEKKVLLRQENHNAIVLFNILRVAKIS